MAKMVGKPVIKTVAIFGSGRVGSGIAQLAARSGYNVNLVDLNKFILGSSIKVIEDNLHFLGKQLFPNSEGSIKNYVESTMSKINLYTDRELAVEKADLVIEAIVEHMGRKIDLFRRLHMPAPRHCLMATTTSSLSISNLAHVIQRDEEFGGMHFLHPVTTNPLVEIIPSPTAFRETTEGFIEFARSLGKTTVISPDTPGFIVNRLMVPLLSESSRMIERGDVSAKDIDLAMEIMTGHNMQIKSLGLDTKNLVVQGPRKYHEPFFIKPIYYKLTLERVLSGIVRNLVGEFKYVDPASKK